MVCCRKCKCGKNKSQDQKNLDALMSDYLKIVELTGSHPCEDSYLVKEIVRITQRIENEE